MQGQTTMERLSRRPRSSEEGTRKLPAPSPPGWARVFERIALFTVALDRAQAPALLEHLAGPHRDAALALGARVAALDSPARQGRVAQEFGERQDAAARLRALSPLLSGPMLQAVSRRLPAHLRNALPEGSSAKPGPDGEGVDAAWAERLVRETIR